MTVRAKIQNVTLENIFAVVLVVMTINNNNNINQCDVY